MTACARTLELLETLGAWEDDDARTWESHTWGHLELLQSLQARRDVQSLKLSLFPKASAAPSCYSEALALGVRA